MKRALLYTVAVLLLLVFAYAVWPTPYRYVVSDGDDILRINRLTHQTYVYGGTNWVYVHDESTYFTSD